MDINKAIEELDELKKSESFEDYLAKNREQIYDLLKAKSEELIEQGVKDVQKGVTDYFIEILNKKAYGRKDAYNTIYILTEGGRGVDFDSHLDIPEDSVVAQKLSEGIELYNKAKEAKEVLTKAYGWYKDIEALNELKDSDASLDNKLEEILYKFIDAAGSVIDKIPAAGLYGIVMKDIIKNLNDTLPKVIDCVSNREIETVLNFVYTEYLGSAYEAKKDIAKKLNYFLRDIDWTKEYTYSEYEALFKNGPTYQDMLVIYNDYFDEHDELSMLDNYLVWRYKYDFKLAIEKHNKYIETLESLRISRMNGKSLDSTFLSIRQYMIENDIPLAREEDNKSEFYLPHGKLPSSYKGEHMTPSSYSGGGIIYNSMDIDTHNITPEGFFAYVENKYNEDPESARTFFNEFMNQYKEEEKRIDENAEFFTNMENVMQELTEKYPELGSQQYGAAKQAAQARDPLVIDLGTPGIELTSVENGVHFDLDKNGFAEKTAWIGREDGFLALDRNGNGFIDDGGELFGDQVIMSNGKTSSSGFEALKDLDTNNDGIIDENDTEFNKLLVWQDTLRNGKTDTGELKTLEELGIKSISLTTENKNHKTESGTIITDSAEVRFTDNRTTEIAEHWFEAHSYDSQELNIEGDGVSLTSFGNMPSLSNALAADESGELSLLIEAFKNTDDFAEKRIITKKILYFITGANEILSDSRGGAVDARDLHVIEAIMGVDSFIGADGNTTPNSNATPVLKELYVQFENLYLSLLDDELGETGYIEYLEEKVDENGNIVIDSEYIDITIENAALHGNNAEKMIFSIGSYLKTYDKACGTNCFAAFKEKYSEYAETLETIINADSVLGTIENDNLNGTNANEIFWGDSGNDTINAGGGNDIIYGGTGDDILNGGAGDDTYYFEKNHGNDIIHDTEGDNKLVFTDGISADDYNMSIDAKLGFVLTHKETGETISMPDFLTNPLNYNFVFEGESQIEGGIEDREVIEGTNADDYLEAGDGFNIFYGGDGNDTLAGGKDMDFMYGGNGNDTIYDGDDGSYLSGGDGDDFLYGGGADVLDGGAGNDYLQGDHGGDTYIFGRGYDTDTVNASSDLNTIIIHNYRASSMINTRNAHNDLIINFGSADSTDCLIIDHFFDYNSNRDFNFVFDDGTVLGQYDITAKYAPIYGTDGDDWLAIQNGDSGIIHGGAGNDGLSGGSGNDELYGEDGDDTLYGNDGNDILDGGVGNDTLCGGNGTDTYIFAKGYGNDTINEWGSDHSIVKLTDVNSDEVTITDQWGSNLVVSINGTEDTLIISNFKWGQAAYSFEFADGAIASVNKDTWELEFSKLPDIPETNEDELVQENADILSKIYADDSLTSDILTETDSTVISDISDSVSVTDESDEVADQTDIQVMILTENMSAFADEDNVFDNADVLNSTDDMSMMNQLLVGSQVQ